jgi:hypothetical protein
MRKRVFEFFGFIVLVMILFSILILVFGMTGKLIFSVQSDFSNCDYNVSCGFSNWVSGETYCLNESQVSSGTCFNITSDSIILDFQGFSITGNGVGAGVWSKGYNSIDIVNGEIIGFLDGVYLSNSGSSQVADLVAFDNSDYGFYFDVVMGSLFDNLSSHDNLDGLFFGAVDECSFRDITSYDNDQIGLYLVNSDDNLLNTVSLNNNGEEGMRMIGSDDNNFGSIDVINNPVGISLSSSKDNLFYNVELRDNAVSTTNNYDSDNSIFYENSKGSIRWTMNETVFSFNGLLDFSGNVNLIANFVSVDSSALPNNFNSSAEIKLDLSNTNITSPKPLRGARVCDDCEVLSFSNHIVTFVVSHFSNYSFTDSHCGDDYCSIRESCSSCDNDCGECDGSSDGASSPVSSLTLNSSQKILIFLSGEEKIYFYVDDQRYYLVPSIFRNDESVSLYLYKAGAYQSTKEVMVNASVEWDVNLDEESDIRTTVKFVNRTNALIEFDTLLGVETVVVDMKDSVVKKPDSKDGDDDDDEKDDEKEGWGILFWILVVVASVIFLIFLGFVIYVALRRSGDGGVIRVERPVAKPVSVAPVAKPVQAVQAAKPVQAAPVAQAAKPVQAAQPTQAAKPAQVTQATQAASAVQAAKPVQEAQPVQETKMTEYKSIELKYVRQYALAISRDSKVRIRYLIQNGKKFVETGDKLSAKEIYKFIFEEYKTLGANDDSLYAEIVAYRSSIGS